MSIAGSSSIADRFVRTTAFLLVPRVRVVGAVGWASTWRWLELGRLLGAGALLIRLVLHGPQRVQGGLLRLGQSSDARDIEALIGPVKA